MTTPNIILINCDDLGYGDLGSYGSTVNKTPALDRMAREGTRFTEFYMASPVCSPSRGAMMTGCYPPRISFGDFVDGAVVLFPGDGIGLNPDEITIAKLLQDAGYATKLVGKWHCGDQPEFLPTSHGFDSYLGIPFSNDHGRQVRNPNPNPEIKWRDHPPLPLVRDLDVIAEQPDQAAITERYVTEAKEFIRENADKPFFLYFAHMHVHVPIYTPDHFERESENGIYGAGVAAIDWSVDVILHELEQLGIDDNTIVIFTSDNGSRARDEGGSNGPLRGHKGETWEGGQRVPFIVRWPGEVPQNAVCEEMATGMDLMPTLASIAGVDAPSDRIIDGHDITPLLTGEAGSTSPWEEFFYYKQRDLEAVRAGKWKLHVRKNGENINELYDLDADAGETKNLHSSHPEIVEQLNQRIEASRRDIGDAAVGAVGENVRPIGRVDNPKPLTQYDPNHPYFMAEYDKHHRG
ncbi:MAG: Cerebroside-sulfatase [Chloroflexi bacterium]|nr:Cerebroside-sulfatase [Chloroflexota bacterium]